MNRVYRMGLDIGIGSVGYAVVSTDKNKENGRIEIFGTRLFDSGEQNDGKDRTSQERRGFRSVRRVLRRRASRKELLKRYVETLGLLQDDQIVEAVENPDANVIPLKCRALEEKVSPGDIFRILIHYCNHRGYKDFYETDRPAAAGQAGGTADESSDDLTEQEKKEQEDEKKTKEALAEFDRRFAESACQTVSQFLCKICADPRTGKIAYRNRDYKVEGRMVIRRALLEDETRKILVRQGSFYPMLDSRAIEDILEIIYRQRAFEDGPGNKDDRWRRYKGFLQSIGMCRFYPEERRGFRFTALGDLYAAVNALSQYRYYPALKEELTLPPEQREEKFAGHMKQIAASLIETVMKDGGLTFKKIEKTAAENGIIAAPNKDVNKTLAKSFKYIRVLKKTAEAAGLQWEPFIQDRFRWTACGKNVSFLNFLGETLSKYRTPAYRKEKLKEAAELAVQQQIPTNEAFWKAVSTLVPQGTSAVSYHYMTDVVENYLKGHLYGDYQWQQEAEKINKQNEQRTMLLSHELLTRDVNLKDNPVVLRSVNETRKVVNELIRIYGMPDYINVEVADDVARSYLERQKIKKQQRQNEKENEKIRTDIAEKLEISADRVTGRQIERYKLYKLQGGKCLYSGEDMDLCAVLDDKERTYEVDHIVPYSLVLDDTLNNKALVCGSENQAKGQRTPLMYLTGDRREKFIERVKAALIQKSHPISRKKYDYLMLDDLYSDEARELLQGWKSRNINDTRYITKYITGLLKNNLRDSTGKSPKVYGIRGHITSRFRRHWLCTDTWGGDVKPRGNDLNHAADAVVIACLTQTDAAFAMAYEKLQYIFRYYGRKQDTCQYRAFLESCVSQLSHYYGMDPEFARSRLSDSGTLPCIIPDLINEVDLRFGSPEGDERTDSEFQSEIEEYYRNKGYDDFIVKPFKVIATTKPNRRFRGAVADSNPVRIVEINGENWKIRRVDIKSINARNIDSLYTTDGRLISALHKALDDRPDKYTVKEYLEDNKLPFFTNAAGQRVEKVSKKEKKLLGSGSFYRKDNTAKNYTILGGMKYYCVEVYRDAEGHDKVWGIRYVDLIRRRKKLYLKNDMLPEGYKSHVCYLFPNDYIEAEVSGKIEFRGFYQSVYNINAKRFYVKEINNSGSSAAYVKNTENSSDSQTNPKTKNRTPSIALKKGMKLHKYAIDLLGRKGGEIDESREGFPCFEPLSSKKANA